MAIDKVQRRFPFQAASAPRTPMSESKGERVDAYLESALLTDDAALAEALRDSSAAGLPSIQVSSLQGKLLHILARGIHARRVLEIGTLGGYSAIWLGRALPKEGRLVSLELDPKHAEVARKNLERAGLAAVAEVRIGAARWSLDGMIKERPEPFDLVFIDADKPNNLAYFEAALRLTHLGSLIVVDNVVREGTIADPANHDPSVEGSRSVLGRMGREPRVLATAVQTVGVKGHDGFAVAIVTG
jgi:predicted O-methyltransferase YrrM